MENKLHFEFTVDETNKIISGLAQLPFGVVAELIGNIQKQAQNQTNVSRNDAEFTVSPPQ